MYPDGYFVWAETWPLTLKQEILMESCDYIWLSVRQKYSMNNTVVWDRCGGK